IREITVKLEEAEAFATREGRRMVSKLAGPVRDLEASWTGAGQGCQGGVGKSSARPRRRWRKNREEERRMNMELQDLLDKTQLKLKDLQAQIRGVGGNLGHRHDEVHRKAQQQIEEAEHRADLAERTHVQAGAAAGIWSHAVGGQGSRSMRRNNEERQTKNKGDS
uniref:t-SNARE coiled-coil homology domain-containing protein n=1 Tax=Macrostomum lignano TaxID=282301 RepID=A0A1I8FSF4_9PLAT